MLDALQYDDARPLVEAELAARFQAAADGVIFAYEAGRSSSIREIIRAAVDQLHRATEDATKNLAAAAKLPFPIAVDHAFFDAVQADTLTRIVDGIADKEWQLRADIDAEIAAAWAERDAVEAEITQMMLEAKRRTKHRMATMLRLAASSDACLDRVKDLNARRQVLDERFMAFRHEVGTTR
jgi:hypothetical protein